jgi:Queuine tRNA-ribosyltransferase
VCEASRGWISLKTAVCAGAFQQSKAGCATQGCIAAGDGAWANRVHGATAGTVKGVTPQQLEETGSQLMLGNTYHLENRPGSGRVARLGGLQEFTGWRRPMLTDSGGFQVGRGHTQCHVTEVTGARCRCICRAHRGTQQAEIVRWASATRLCGEPHDTVVASWCLAATSITRRLYLLQSATAAPLDHVDYWPVHPAAGAQGRDCAKRALQPCLSSVTCPLVFLSLPACVPLALLRPQMVSLLHMAEITEEGVTFETPRDGRMLLTPEQSVAIQNRLGTLVQRAPC